MRAAISRYLPAPSIAALALVATVALAGCGSDDPGGGTTVRTSTTNGPRTSSPVKLVYLADSPYGKATTADQLRAGVATLKRRARLLGLPGTAIRTRGQSKIAITYPPEDFVKPASSQLPVQGRLLFYDFEADLIGSDEPIPDIFEAVTRASKRPAVDSPDNTTGRQYYLFGGLRNYRGGPTGNRDALLAKFNGKLPADSEIKTVQPGTVVVLAKPLANSLDSKQFDGDYILQDRPQLDNTGIAAPKFSDASGKPAVAFQFTPDGRRRLQRMTARIAGRGLAAGNDSAPGTFAVVLDNQILSRAAVDPKQYPKGLDGGEGAEVSGDINEQQARALAAVLESGPLPFRLIPLLQTQVQSG